MRRRKRNKAMMNARRPMPSPDPIAAPAIAAFWFGCDMVKAPVVAPAVADARVGEAFSEPDTVCAVLLLRWLEIPLDTVGALAVIELMAVILLAELELMGLILFVIAVEVGGLVKVLPSIELKMELSIPKGVGLDRLPGVLETTVEGDEVKLEALIVLPTPLEALFILPATLEAASVVVGTSLLGPELSTVPELATA